MSRHFTRSALSGPQGTWTSAGVLPFTYDGEGRCFLLLGAEPVRTGPKGRYVQVMLSDFGGRREAIDEDAEATASR
jgi:hypothetical protein